MRFLLLLIFLFGWTGSVWAAEQSGTLTYSFNLTDQPAEDTRLWVPYPVSDANQLIENVRIEGDYAHVEVVTDRIFQAPMLAVRWAKDAPSRKLTFAFDVQRKEVVHPERPKDEAAWNPADYKLWLAATSNGPIDGMVKMQADQITAGKTSVQAKAKAIYDWICENMYRDPKTRGCGIGNVKTLLKQPGGKCADIHSVFVALARAAGVPSREVFGIRQGKKDGQDLSTWQHCWAEFYQPGYGWVQVDPGDVRKMMLKQNLTLKDAKTAEYRKYFWGGLDPYRVRLNHGRDLTLNGSAAKGTLNYLMYPHAEVGGKTLDWLDPKTFKYQIVWNAKK